MPLSWSLLTFTPRVCEWELTLQCNLECKHCSAIAGKARDNELTTNEAIDLAHQLGKAGCKQVALSGGEPILRPDWPHIAKTLSDQGIYVSMFTNGWSFKLETAYTAKAVGIKQVNVSIDGMEKTHDRIRRREGSFKKALEALHHLESANIFSGVFTSINQWNLDEIEEIHELLLNEGVRYWQLWLSSPTEHHSRNFWLKPESLLSLIPRLAASKAA